MNNILLLTLSLLTLNTNSFDRQWARAFEDRQRERDIEKQILYKKPCVGKYKDPFENHKVVEVSYTPDGRKVTTYIVGETRYKNTETYDQMMQRRGKK